MNILFNSVVLLGLFTICSDCMSAQEQAPLAEYEELPPGERYSQLTFLLHVTDGFDPALLELLEQGKSKVASTNKVSQDMESLQDSGRRIANPRSIIDETIKLLNFRTTNEAMILAELTQIENENPTLSKMIDKVALAEEAILVRSAFTETAEFYLVQSSTLSDQSLTAFKERTLRIRNDMEFVAYESEIDDLTAEAVLESTGRMEAHHRVVDSESPVEFIRERILATEKMNVQVKEEHQALAQQRVTRLMYALQPTINRYNSYNYNQNSQSYGSDSYDSYGAGDEGDGDCGPAGGCYNGICTCQ